MVPEVLNKNKGKPQDIQEEGPDYRSMVGSLLWLQGGTRTETTFAVIKVGSGNIQPTNEYFMLGKRMGRYIDYTKDVVLVYQSTNAFDFKKKIIYFIAYCDSDFSGCKDICRSTYGNYFYFG